MISNKRVYYLKYYIKRWDIYTIEIEEKKSHKIPKF